MFAVFFTNGRTLSEGKAANVALNHVEAIVASSMLAAGASMVQLGSTFDSLGWSVGTNIDFFVLRWERLCVGSERRLGQGGRSCLEGIPVCVCQGRAQLSALLYPLVLSTMDPTPPELESFYRPEVIFTWAGFSDDDVRNSFLRVLALQLTQP